MRKLVLFLFFLLSLPLQPVQADIGTRQGVRIAAALVKSGAGLWTDSQDLVDMKAAKKGAIAKACSRLANLLNKALNLGSDIPRHILCTNAAVWQVAKDVQEFLTLQELEAEHGKVVPLSVLQEYYRAAATEGASLNELEFEEIFQSRSPSWRDRLKPLVRFAGLACSLCAIGQELEPQGEHAMRLGENLCDLILRYLCNDKEFRPKGKLGKAEFAFTLAALLSDMGNSSYRLVVGDEEPEALVAEEDDKKTDPVGGGNESESTEEDDRDPEFGGSLFPTEAPLEGLFLTKDPPKVDKELAASWLKHKEFRVRTVCADENEVKQKKKKDEDSKDYCPICLGNAQENEGKKFIKFPCHHEMCEDCFSALPEVEIKLDPFKTNSRKCKSKECPICRKCFVKAENRLKCFNPVAKMKKTVFCETLRGDSAGPPVIIEGHLVLPSSRSENAKRAHYARLVARQGLRLKNFQERALKKDGYEEIKDLD